MGVCTSQCEGPRAGKAARSERLTQLSDMNRRKMPTGVFVRVQVKASLLAHNIAPTE